MLLKFSLYIHEWLYREYRTGFGWSRKQRINGEHKITIFRSIYTPCGTNTYTKKSFVQFRNMQSIIAGDKSHESRVGVYSFQPKCHGLHYVRPPQSIIDRRKKKREEKKNSRHRGVGHPEAHRRIATAACGAAYGAWLPIVKIAAYLTDFMVDRIFRMNPG